MSTSTKPKGVLYIAIFYLVIAAVLIIAAFVIPASQTLLDFIKSLPIVGKYFGHFTITTVLLVICGAIAALDAIGLIMLKPWARLLGMLIGLVLILIGWYGLYYLATKDEAKKAFGVPASPQEKPANDRKVDNEES